jgi:hypothetical protein
MKFRPTNLIGSILCRLPVDTIAVREVGKLLQTSKFAGAFFVVQGEGIDNQQFKMPTSTIEGMIKTHQFQMPSVQIRTTHKSKPIDIMLQLPTREMYSISGFPRLLHNQFRSEFFEPVFVGVPPTNFFRQRVSMQEV